MKKILIVLAMIAGTLALGVSPASAHTGDLKASYVCQADGTYLVTYTLSITQTGLKGSTKWDIGTSSFEGTPSNANGLNRGPVASDGAQTITLGTEVYPGNATVGNWVYAYTTWSDQFAKGSDGRVDTFPGDCKPPKPGDKVITSEWVAGDHVCTDKTYKETRTVTTTKFVYDAKQDKYVPSEPTTVTETRTVDNDEFCAQPDAKVVVGEWVAGDHVCTDKTYKETRTVTTTKFVYDAKQDKYVPSEPTTVTETRTVDNDEFCAQPEALVTQTSSSAYECGDAFETKTTVTKTINYVYDAESDGYVMDEPVLTEADEQVPADVVDCEVVEPPTGVDVCPLLPGVQIDADDCGEVVSPPGDENPPAVTPPGENPRVVVTVTARTPAANAPVHAQVAASAGVLPNTGGTNMAALLSGLAFVFMGAFALVCGSRRPRKN